MGAGLRGAWRTGGVIGMAAGALLLAQSAADADDKALCRGNNPDEAIAACTRLLAAGDLRGRDLARTLSFRGISLRDKDNRDAALADFDQAIRVDPTYDQAFVQRGQTWHLKGDFDRALADYNEAIRLDPKWAPSYFHRGRARYKKNDLTGASADFNEALRIDPKIASRVCATNDASPDDGLKGCTLQIDSGTLTGRDLAKTYSFRAFAWRQKGDLDRAIVDFDTAIRTDASYAFAYYQRARTWQQKNDPARAREDMRQAMRLHPPYAKEVCEEKGKPTDDTFAACTQWIKAGNAQGPDRAKAHIRLATFWKQKDKPDQALAEYDEALRGDPANVAAYYGRGGIWRAKKNYDRAIADYSEAIRLDPKHADAYFYRASSWRQKDDLDRALADYNEAIRLDPKDPTGYYNRAHIWRTKNNPTRAIADYTEAIRIDPGHTDAYARRGLTYESINDRERARADFRTALSLPLPKDDKWAHETARVRLGLLTDAKSEPQTPAPSAESGGRIALVIGNGAYANEGKLHNTTNDARAVATALRQIGFEVISGTDLDYAGMERLIREFLRKASSARVALLFFSGHGMQIDGKNYLVPTDAKPVSRASFAFEQIDLDRILAGLEDDARTNIIILDACRNNPFEPSTTKAAGGTGLAPYTSVGAGTLIAFATAPNKTSTTGTGTISPFTAALVKHIRTPGLELYQVLLRVRIEVAEATKKKQIPWVNSSLMGEVYLAGRRQEAAR